MAVKWAALKLIAEWYVVACLVSVLLPLTIHDEDNGEAVATIYRSGNCQTIAGLAEGQS